MVTGRRRTTRHAALLLAALAAVAAGCGTAASTSTPHWTSSVATATVPAATHDGANASAGADRTPGKGGQGGQKVGPSNGSGSNGSGGSSGGSVPGVGVAVPHTDFPGTIILGAPTDSSVLISVMPDAALTLYVEFGPAAGSNAAKTDAASAAAMTPVMVTLGGLPSNASIYYRVRYRNASSDDFAASKEASFHTQRLAGSTFTFSVEADPHLNIDGKTQPALVRAELANVAAAHPDFLIDLGDTFLGDKFAHSYDQLAAQYESVRDYFGITGPSVPLYLVNGNHEGEDGFVRDGATNNLHAWAVKLRHLYYPLPTAGGFYSGSTSEVAPVGRLDSYYAWTWGDCLFVTLDLYNYTLSDPQGSGGDMWQWTLGEEQYRWLTSVLSTSTTKYKFVFAHHAIGDIRGGVEVAALYEWGGNDKNGAYLFDQKRPGWGVPITGLFEKYGVSIFFQGHDHLFVRQERNGVVYEEVPQPGTPDGADAQTKAHEEAYTSGVIEGSPGHLNVTVSSSGIRVDYVRSSLTASGPTANGSVAYSYLISARK